MKYVVEVEGRKHEIEVLGDQFIVDGEPLDVDVRRIGDLPLYSMLVDSRSIEVSVEEDGRYQYSVMLGGELYTVGVQPAIRAAIAGAEHKAAGGNTVRAPMPGLVASVPVTLGQRVAAGTVLIVLESMKMENPLMAHADGVVAQLHVEPRQSVDKGQTLVTLTLDETPEDRSGDLSFLQ